MAQVSCPVVVFYNGQIEQTANGDVYYGQQLWLDDIYPPITFLELQSKILEEYEGVNVQIKKILYRMPFASGPQGLQYCSFPILKDKNVNQMFTFFQSVAECRRIKLYVEFEENHISNHVSIAQQQIGAFPHASSSHAVVHASSSCHIPHSTSLEHALHARSSHNYADHMEVHEDEAEEPCNDDIEEEMNNLTIGGQVDPSLSQLQFSSQSQSHTRAEHYSLVDSEGARVDPRGSTPQLGGEHALTVGKLFYDKEAVMNVVKRYSIRESVQHKVHESDLTTYSCKCVKYGETCNWSIRVTYCRKLRMWEVRKVTGPHTCSVPENRESHAQMDYHVICNKIYETVQKDPSATIKSLKAQVEKSFNFNTTYRKVWMAKQKAISLIFGDWEESYNDLPRWLGGMQFYMPHSIIDLQTRPYQVQGYVDDNFLMFHRLFWSFSPCIEAFKYCKPLISIDGTHLYGKYGGTLLMAIAQDGNCNILPIAFVVVEGETKDAWAFFLKNLRQNITPQQGILVISDRHNAIKGALEAEGSGWHPPSAYHVYCARHIISNFAVKFKNTDAKKVLMNAAYAKMKNDFEYWWDILGGIDPAIQEWANNIPREKWAHYADDGRKFGHMTTNISKCMNAVLKGTRNLPITAIVKSTYFRLCELFVKKGMEAEAQLATMKEFCPFIEEAHEKMSRVFNKMEAYRVTRDSLEYLVTEKEDLGSYGRHEFRVHLTAGWCDCGEFQKLHFPCRHAHVAASNARRHWRTLVHDVYRTHYAANVYSVQFSPIVNEESWPPYNGKRLLPDPTLRRTLEGRPVSTRIYNEMDKVELGRPNRCGLCREVGHTRRSCPHAPSSSHHV